ncbi:MAG: ParA family protein [Cyanobacteriota bacterium]
MTKVISIIDTNNKAGKTTNSVNICTWLALLGKKVLLIDLDPNAMATSFFLEENLIVNVTLEDVFIEEKPLSDAIIESQVRNLYIVPSINMNEHFIHDIFEENIFILRDYIDNLDEKFDYIFIDNSISDPVFMNTIFNSSDQIILLVRVDESTEQEIVNNIDKIFEIKENSNKWLEISGILFNFYTENMKSKEIINNYKEKFGNIVYKTIIPKNLTLSESFNSLSPIALYDIKSFVSDIYLRLAREFLQNNELKI